MSGHSPLPSPAPRQTRQWPFSTNNPSALTLYEELKGFFHELIEAPEDRTRLEETKHLFRDYITALQKCLKKKTKTDLTREQLTELTCRLCEDSKPYLIRCKPPIDENHEPPASQTNKRHTYCVGCIANHTTAADGLHGPYQCNLCHIRKRVTSVVPFMAENLRYYLPISIRSWPKASKNAKSVNNTRWS